LDYWQRRQALAQVATSLERPCQTNLEEITCREASLSGCEILCKFKKNVLSKFFWDNWMENASEEVVSSYHLIP
jgi:hypothetical protein